MHPGTRACIAYLAGRIVSGAFGSYLYDRVESKRLDIGGTIVGPRIGLYDYDRGCNFSGVLPSLHDYGTCANVTLTVEGRLFGGHDHRSGHDFSGSVDGGLISMSDHATAQHFSYAL